ncbi:SDR family oxidoreductase [Streptomyces iconiensis]|uniref:SDR family oxidoreductase n=1 Tax=Streptomyces iconiensis TaxID=1384038 RepID=A0ABT6ZS33_9ACTN|nr:SDR family oxidoreductase [Streptomyces iconiensis]MDJ1131849.1 SDR family oxidoreductase [Streptomyces iconiensis]
MTSPILVTGGTGTLGRLLVPRLTDAGRQVRVLSRSRYESGDGAEFVQGDLAKGEALESAVDGVRVIVHCASDKRGDAQATRNLVRAVSSHSPAPHLVYVSIVGVDRISLGYFRSKLESERIVADSGLPWTTLRATQFYDLILKGVSSAAKLPLVPIPSGFRVQPLDADEVAARLADIALDPHPAGRAPDIAGPEATTAADLLRTYLHTTGRPNRKILSLRMPGTRAIRNGTLLPQGPLHTTTRTWSDFLAKTPAPA